MVLEGDRARSGPLPQGLPGAQTANVSCLANGSKVNRRPDSSQRRPPATVLTPAELTGVPLAPNPARIWCVERLRGISRPWQRTSTAVADKDRSALL